MCDISIINSGLLMKNITVPVGPLLIASVLKKNGHDVEFKDYQGKKLERRFNINTFKKFCETDAPILAISVMCNSMPIVLGAVEQIKKENPEKIIILGGPGATDLNVKILKYFPVDYIVVGEGEITIVELLDAIKNKKDISKVKGIAYVKDGQPVLNPPRERIKDVSGIPLPAYEMINFDDYNKVQTIITARGCPFSCKFCSANSIWQHKMTYREIDDIVAEILYLSDKQTNLIAFSDDTFVLDKNRVEKIISAVRAEGVNIPWACNCKVTLMDKEWYDFLEKTNCYQVFYGIEAGSDRVLKKINKGHTIEQAKKVIKETAECVSSVRTSYIWGYPFETLEDFYDLIQALYSDMQISHVKSQMSLLSPLPSSELYQEYGNEIEFDLDAQSRAGGLPVGEYISNYPDTIELILKYPELFSSFYYYRQDNFDKKLQAIKKVDWAYDEQKVIQKGYLEAYT